MSKYNVIRCEFRNLASLRAALTETAEVLKVPVGEFFSYHETPVQLRGYGGDLRPEKAHLVIPRGYVGTAANDIGFVRRADGRIDAIISDWDMQKGGERILNRVRPLYGKHEAIRKARKQGYTVESATVQPNGAIQLVLAHA